MPENWLCVACWLQCRLVGCKQSLILSEIWNVTIFSESNPWFRVLCEILWTVLWTCLESNRFRKIWWGNFMIGWRKGFLKSWIHLHISTGRMRGTYLHSDVFYSFCFKPAFRQHPVNVIFFNWNIYSLDVLSGNFNSFIYSFSWRIRLKCVCKSKEISVI